MADTRRHDSGFALILAILALMLLTFLGLTLATTTSTELQIASNYRNAQQALYNAESGLEVGKRVLRNFSSWGMLLPFPRPTTAFVNTLPVWGLARVGASGEASRNFENCPNPSGNCCDNYAYEGYGVVLDPLNTAFPYQNIVQYQNTPPVPESKGTFTIWLRRPIIFDPATGLPMDNTNNEVAILTVEGTAPYTTAGTAYTQRNRAVRVLEAYVGLQSWKCNSRGEESGSSEGNGNMNCSNPPTV